ncbi:DUF4326 domain-containing protein [Nonomuraea lactucae]|uniref:DUF4326 domain-containing protein n=1 Tax=Nonomuraea lactucae TaxID=2249762 RepID=UPI000DE40AD4|nr:DUF4326 domain-containing protein [Nonomuraea lactucae]
MSLTPALRGTAAADIPAPKRIQQKRQRGWRLPPNARSVARPSKYGNPFVVRPCDRNCCWTIDDPAGIAFRSDEYPDQFSTKEDAVKVAVELYELHTGPMGSYELDVEEVRRDLAGKDLACWCPLPGPGEPDHCHAA